ncbi:hypothetical protein GCM10010409_30270 [Mycolicibacterium diernhoferi]
MQRRGADLQISEPGSDLFGEDRQIRSACWTVGTHTDQDQLVHGASTLLGEFRPGRKTQDEAKVWLTSTRGAAFTVAVPRRNHTGLPHPVSHGRLDCNSPSHPASGTATSLRRRNGNVHGGS